MFRPNWKYLLAGLVVLAVFAMLTPEADACRRSRGSGWGSSCYTSSCYTPVSYTSYYSPSTTACDTSCDPCGTSISSCGTTSCNPCSTTWSSGWSSPYRQVGFSSGCCR